MDQVTNLHINIVGGSQRITVDGDTAHADTQAIAFVVPTETSDRVVVQSIRYIDRMVRTADGWKISERSGREGRNRAHDTPFEAELLLDAKVGLAELLATLH